MKKLFIGLLALLPMVAAAQTPTPKADEKTVTSQPTLPVTSVTQHTVRAGGQPLAYTATTGYLVLEDEAGTHKANIFYMAYTKNGVTEPGKRPIAFVFNGGPGSASVWLHMGVIGPKIIPMTEKGDSFSPPYSYTDNPDTWLQYADLVFIDPVNTGYSRPAPGQDPKQFLGYEEDIRTVGEFIRRYTTENKRWTSPKFLAGESYGTTRAAGLSKHMLETHNMFFNGIALISTILNFQTARFDRGNDMPYVLFLPTYTAMAWYHGKIAPQYKGNLEATLQKVREFAGDEYLRVLFKGDQATEAEKASVAKKVAEFTGVSEEYVRRANLRLEISRFTKELRRADGLAVGRLDGRMTSPNYDDAGEATDFDPSLNRTISGPYSHAINQYIRQDLKFESKLPYLILTGRVQPWNYNNVANRYLNVGEELRDAMTRNPFQKVWVLAGYYDLATPFFAAEYTFNTMQLKPEQRKNVRFTYYESGHMMYIHKPSLDKMAKDAAEFFKWATPN